MERGSIFLTKLNDSGLFLVGIQNPSMNVASTEATVAMENIPRVKDVLCKFRYAAKHMKGPSRCTYVSQDPEGDSIRSLLQDSVDYFTVLDEADKRYRVALDKHARGEKLSWSELRDLHGG